MWIRVTCILLLGYLSLSRAFAYLGIPAWKIFISEVALVFLWFCGPRIHGASWPSICFRLSSLRPFVTKYSLFLVYGVIQSFHGMWAGNPPLLALRDLAFHYYPLYFFVGLWAGITRPELLPKLLRGFAWFNAIYGLLFILFLNRMEWYVPGVDNEVTLVSIFGQPLYSFVALLGLLAFEKNSHWLSLLLPLNGAVMLGMQFRSEWLAFTVGLAVWLVMKGKRVFQAGLVLTLLFALLYVTDFTIPTPQGRASADFSVQQLVDRALAPFRADVTDLDVAAGGGNVDSQEATFAFRTVWWRAIWNSVNKDLPTALFGHGYGFALGDLVPYLEGQFIRTPHNHFFYALGYTGWVGVALFILFQWGILRLLWQSMLITREPFGLAFWAAMMTFGMFFGLCETPYGAIPLYLITGWLAAPALFRRQPRRFVACHANEESFVSRRGIERLVDTRHSCTAFARERRLSRALPRV